MKKILIPVLAVLFTAPALAPTVSVEKESKSTTPVVAAVSAENTRQMEAERASRSSEVRRAAVDKRKAKIAKAKKVALAKKKKAQALAKKREQARLAHIAWHKEQDRLKKKAETRKKATQVQSPKTNSGFSGGSPKAFARSLVGDGQFGCLEALWNKESGWNHLADNPNSDAYGIPQALPGSKMASAGADWATNPITQIKWGVGYIEGRYGSPCAAWAHSQANNWY